MLAIMGIWILVALSIAFDSPLWITTILIGSLTAAIISSLKFNNASDQLQRIKQHPDMVSRKTVTVS